MITRRQVDERGIPFTQYLLPNGRQEPVWIKRPAAVEDKARAIIDAGYVFECEMLSTGAISLTIGDKEAEEDLEIEVVANGPPVPLAVDRMIERFEIPGPAGHRHGAGD